MKQTTLTIHLPSDLIQGARRYVKQRQMSLTQFIALYLRQLVLRQDLLDNPPTVRRVSGSLPVEASIDEYHAYLEEKHGDLTAI